MPTPLKLLLVEDNPLDAELVLRALRRGGYEPESRRVETEEDYRAALSQGADLIISDYHLPLFSGLRALELLRESGTGIPLILISGTIGEDLAVETIRLGAHDYLLKDRLTRLGLAVGNALEEARLRREGRATLAALQESERFARAALDGLSAHIAILDETGTIQAVNSAWKTFAAANGAAHRISEGANYLRVCDEACGAEASDARTAAAAIRDVLAGRLPFREIEYACHSPTERRWFTARITPFPGEGPRRVVVAHENITERRKLEEQFLQAQKMQAIGTLAGGIAHDFNNILAAIIGFSELAAKRAASDPVTREYLDSVLEAGRRAASLIRQILTFSRRQEVQRHPIQLSQALGEPLRLLRSTIPSTIAFDTFLPADLPLVLAEPTQIHQVLMNLCTNAAHAMGLQSGRLSVHLSTVSVDKTLAQAIGLHPGTHVMLSVSDTGCGMDPATQARIFEPFFSTKPPGEGTGLGLSVVHGIMQSHGGTITVDSHPGKGSEFRLYFPAIEDESAGPAASAPAATPKGAGQTILFVDDESPIALLGEIILTELGYRVEKHTAPDKALAAFRADPGRFSLVMTDLTMPGMTGTELARLLREIRPDLPIVLISGFNATLSAEDMRARGIVRLLAKPFTMNTLAETVQLALLPDT